MHIFKIFSHYSQNGYSALNKRRLYFLKLVIISFLIIYMIIYTNCKWTPVNKQKELSFKNLSNSRHFNLSLSQSLNATDQNIEETRTKTSASTTTTSRTTTTKSRTTVTYKSTDLPMSSTLSTTRGTTTPDPRIDRCKEVRRRISHGLEDYARSSGDEELQALVQPIFTNKKLVVWSADHHIGPISDLRSLFEPLGVEFLEHTLFHNCEVMCTCDQLSRTKVLDKHNIIRPLGADLIERFVREYRNDSDLNRADAFISSWSANLLELFMRYNKSIIFQSPLRIDAPINSQPEEFRALVKNIRKAATNEANVMAANNRYDVHYIRYFTGMSIDYVPSFCVYTGETYNPIRKSFLLWERRFGFNNGLREYWTEHFDGHIKRTGYKFDLRDVRVVYRGHEYRDVAKHLAITYVPYQVSVMSFLEQYRMDIPLLCPTKEFLIFLHHKFYTVYDRTKNGGYFPSAKGSSFPPHPSMAGTPDPNNDFDLASISYWLPLSDCYQFPYITYFESFENLVDTLHNITETRLWQISRSMRMWNCDNLKEILRYWRRRLLNIAFYSKL